MERPSCTRPGVGGDLLRIHNICTRALSTGCGAARAFASKGGFPDRGTRRGFLRYARTLHAALHSHHLTEDDLAFPVLEQRLPQGPYQQLHEQHQHMDVLLDRARIALDTLEGGDDGALPALADALRRLQDLWLPHILIEESIFTPETIDRLFPAAEQAELAKRFAKHAQDHGGPGAFIVPFLLFHLDPAERRILASHLPWFLVRVLVPFAWRGTWQPMARFFPRFGAAEPAYSAFSQT